MRAFELKPLIQSIEQRAAREFGADAEAAIRSVALALDRFAELPLDVFASRMATLKPPAARKKPATSNVQSDAVAKYVDQLRLAFGDGRSTSEIMRRLRADKAILKPEAIAIAKALGVPATSKTPKGHALNQIEGLSTQRESDVHTAERIRKGA